jgi:hypothetical protein
MFAPRFFVAKPTHSWGDFKSPDAQEAELMYYKTAARPFWERTPKGYCNFQFLTNTRYGKDRVKVFREIPHDLLFIEPKKTQRIYCWKNMIECAFVVSPAGNGYDCHRTWEALALGCIPILRSSGLDPLFEGLPCLIVGEWSDITQQLLEQTINEFRLKEWNYEKLTLDYWKKVCGNTILNELAI